MDADWFEGEEAKNYYEAFHVIVDYGLESIFNVCSMIYFGKERKISEKQITKLQKDADGSEAPQGTWIF